LTGVNRRLYESPNITLDVVVLRLTTLGSLAIADDGGAATWLATRRRALAILALAAAHGHNGISRDQAMALLWPELDASAARNNLKQTAFAIRHALGVDVFDRGVATLRLDERVIAADVIEFEYDVAAGRFAEAAARYRGPFLDGFFLPRLVEFERWTDRARSRLAWRYGHALERLAADARERDDRRAHAEWCRRLADHDPFSTLYALGLISALADAGEPLAALKHAREYTQLVREEFDAEPDGRIQRAAERVRRSLTIDVSSPTSESPKPAKLASYPPVFIERDPQRVARISGPRRQPREADFGD
jgi:DNA-binding SARP family transcriptional activator